MLQATATYLSEHLERDVVVMETAGFPAQGCVSDVIVDALCTVRYKLVRDGSSTSGGYHTTMSELESISRKNLITRSASLVSLCKSSRYVSNIATHLRCVALLRLKHNKIQDKFVSMCVCQFGCCLLSTCFFIFSIPSPRSSSQLCLFFVSVFVFLSFQPSSSVLSSRFIMFHTARSYLCFCICRHFSNHNDQVRRRR